MSAITCGREIQSEQGHRLPHNPAINPTGLTVVGLFPRYAAPSQGAVEWLS